jgi:cytidine deaminase
MQNENLTKAFDFYMKAAQKGYKEAMWMVCAMCRKVLKDKLDKNTQSVILQNSKRKNLDEALY